MILANSYRVLLCPLGAEEQWVCSIKVNEQEQGGSIKVPYIAGFMSMLPPSWCTFEVRIITMIIRKCIVCVLEPVFACPCAMHVHSHFLCRSMYTQ